MKSWGQLLGTGALLVSVAGGAWLLIRQYGSWREEQAILRRQADSLTAVLQTLNAEIANRQINEGLLAQQMEEWKAKYLTLGTQMAAQRSKNLLLLDSLEALLTAMPDDQATPIRVAFEGLQREAQLCSSALSACDSVRVAGEQAIASRDSTIGSQSSLLQVYQERLATAVNRKPSFLSRMGWPVAAIMSATTVVLLLSR